MIKPHLLTSTVGVVSAAASCAVFAASPAPRLPGTSRPNIVFILADDLGYGDVRCLNPNGKIKTPCMDRLASQGMVFTDAHSTSAVCSPSRYAILTGRYNWRSTLQNGVLHGYSGPLIKENQLTVGRMLQQNGYTTAAIGKWHLGFDWTPKPGAPATDAKNPPVDFTKPIKNGPITRGFDYFFGISASLDMPPYVYIKDDLAVEPVTKKMTHIRTGPAGDTFDASRCVPDFTQHAADYIAERARDPGGKPFFLYLAMPSPHTPILPTKEFQGRSGISPYADYVMETDWALGRVMDAIERAGIAGNTIVIFTSDNGCSPAAGVEVLRKAGHEPSAQFRGLKADIWEGGHRVPFIVRWPARVKASATCADIVTQADFMATCADILGIAGALPSDAAVDSTSFLPDLLQKATAPVHEAVVHHSINGKFSIRQGDWKLELCPGSGGWMAPRDPAAAARGLPDAQLYDLSRDIAEQKNLVAEKPDVAKRLAALLEKYVNDGRTTPGPRQGNDVKIDIHKPVKPVDIAKARRAAEEARSE